MTRYDARAVLVLLAVAVLFTGSQPASAHPHVFVTSHANVLFKGGTISALQFEWTFDDGYSAMAVEGLDANKDGVYDRQELAELAKVNIEGLKEFEYFTRAAIDGSSVSFGEPTDAWLEYNKAMLTLHFTLPLAPPVDPQGKSFQFAIADPSGFIAFEPEDVPVSLIGDGAAKCGIASSGPPAESADMVPLGPPEGTITLTCSR